MKINISVSKLRIPFANLTLKEKEFIETYHSTQLEISSTPGYFIIEGRQDALYRFLYTAAIQFDIDLV